MHRMGRDDKRPLNINTNPTQSVCGGAEVKGERHDLRPKDHGVSVLHFACI